MVRFSKRIARARGRLRAIGQHPPLAIGRTRQIHRKEMQIAAARNGHTRQRAEEKPDSRKASGGNAAFGEQEFCGP